jgi:hypothetical protein
MVDVLLGRLCYTIIKVLWAYQKIWWIVSENFVDQVLDAMQTRLTRKPGQKGTRQLQLQYGEALVCVRYRYDERRRKRLKTVELVVEEREWMPDNTLVLVRVALAEIELRAKVKQAGGRWLPEKRLWELPYRSVMKLGLGDRVVRDWDGRG